MKKRFTGIIFSFVIAAWFLPVNSQTPYTTNESLNKRIADLASKYPGTCSVSVIGKTLTGIEIKVITVGTGDKNNKPAIAVVGGIESGYRLGREIAIGFAEHLASAGPESDIKSLLEKVTFYIIPEASPEAGMKPGEPATERSVNSRSVDEDRDFVNDEDPAEDLDKDGFITMIRVSDPTGTMTLSSEDPRILVVADLAKGEKGKYRVFSEGIDNDGDGLFNEDGRGGVNFNRNFTFNYEEFGINAGIHAVSEPESKAVADFLYDRFNIYAVFSIGPQDNLGQPMKASERPSAQQENQSQGQMQFSPRMMGDRRITSIMRSDETVNKLVSEKYHEITGLRGAPPVKHAPGNFMDWAYYHYGRYSFSTPGWWFTSDKIKNTEAAYLKFAADNKISSVFTEWKEISHPDFAGKKVEVGGLRPYASITPPDSAVTVLVKKHSAFLTSVAKMHPEIEITDLKTENLGEGIFRVSLKVLNSGIFATCAEVGDFNQWTRIMRVTVTLSQGQSLLNGQMVQRIRRLEGGQSAEFSWLVSGKGKLLIKAGAVNTGFAETGADLK